MNLLFIVSHCVQLVNSTIVDICAEAETAQMSLALFALCGWLCRSVTNGRTCTKMDLLGTFWVVVWVARDRFHHYSKQNTVLSLLVISEVSI